MTAQIACWTLGAIAFLLAIVGIIFGLTFNNEELFVKYRHWTRPLLFMSSIAWLVVMIVVMTGTVGG